jgi:hypothetical protein
VETEPCVPSPCGTNAICEEKNGNAICSCPPDYQGDPYTFCRPECVLNGDCPNDKACQRLKCVDPCPGTCGASADCRVVNHVPVCTCAQGYTGDPFSGCRPVPVITEPIGE